MLKHNVTLSRPAGVRFMTETTTSIKVDLQSEISKEYDNIQIEIINLGDNYSVTALSDAHKE